MATLPEDDDFHAYDGPRYDALSIVLTVLISLSFIPCCWTICYNDKVKGKREYSRTSQHENNGDAMNESQYKCNCNFKYGSCLSFILLSFPAILIFILGVNLIVRYERDECNYYVTATCGGDGGGNYRNTGPTTIVGKECSSECVLLYTFGLVLSSIGALVIFGLICYYVYLYFKKRLNDDNVKPKQIGCDCCYLKL